MSNYAKLDKFERCFRGFVTSVVTRECKRLDYADGFDAVDRLVNQVFEQAKSLRDWNEQRIDDDVENSVCHFLKILSFRVVHASFGKKGL